MTTLNQICEYLESFAPTQLAEDWDNVGLLVGDRSTTVNNVMTCLTITPESAAEAIEQNANLIVTHHPLPFRPIKKLTTDSTPTKMLLQLIQHDVAIYSPHTAFDSANDGINQSVCELIGLEATKPLVPRTEEPRDLGAGRQGALANKMALAEFIELLKQKFDVNQIRFVGDDSQIISSVASACGSGGSFIASAVKANCDALITGEADFHSCLEASAQKVALILLGHYVSERFAIEMLAKRMEAVFPNLNIWPSKKESDPIKTT